MRISSSTMFSMGLATIQQQYGDLQTLQQEVGTSRSFLTPADNPSGAASVLQLTQIQSTNAQYTTNGKNATSALSLQDTVLEQTGNLIQSIHDIAVQAANGATMNNSDRASMATTLKADYSQLLALSNSTDSNGQYIFSGFQGNNPPFSQGAPTATNPSGVTYNGDQGQRLMQVSSSALVPVSTSGANIFQLIKNGNGIVTSSATAGNTGSGTVGNASVNSPATWAANAQTFTITFDALTPQGYTITPPPTTTPATGVYKEGAAINIDGAQMSISGTPGANDSFTLAPSSNQSIFDTVQNMITSLDTPVVGAVGKANLSNSMSAALNNLNMGLNSVLTARAVVGSAINEVAAQAGTNASMDLQNSKKLSTLQDVDLAKVLSSITQETASLTAAQKSFVLIQGLSLFTYVQ